MASAFKFYDFPVQPTILLTARKKKETQNNTQFVLSFRVVALLTITKISVTILLRMYSIS